MCVCVCLSLKSIKTGGGNTITKRKIVIQLSLINSIFTFCYPQAKL
jgi:hypothetical protein